MTFTLEGATEDASEIFDDEVSEILVETASEDLETPVEDASNEEVVDFNNIDWSNVFDEDVNPTPLDQDPDVTPETEHLLGVMDGLGDDLDQILKEIPQPSTDNWVDPSTGITWSKNAKEKATLLAAKDAAAEDAADEAKTEGVAEDAAPEDVAASEYAAHEDVAAKDVADEEVAAKDAAAKAVEVTADATPVLNRIGDAISRAASTPKALFNGFFAQGGEEKDEASVTSKATTATVATRRSQRKSKKTQFFF